MQEEAVVEMNLKSIKGSDEPAGSVGEGTALCTSQIAAMVTQRETNKAGEKCTCPVAGILMAKVYFL